MNALPPAPPAPVRARPSARAPDPTITILLPVRDEAALLPRAVRSIQRQTRRDWELLLIDDGSTDGSPDVIASLARGDPRIRPLRLEHRGIAGALNAGLDRARGNYVARMDADDVSHRDRLALQVACLEGRPDLCAVGSRVRIFPRGSMSDGMRLYEAWLNSLLTPEEIAREIFVESPLVHPSTLIRREALERIGGYREDGPEDYDLWLRMHRAGMRFGKVPRTLLAWMDRPERATRCSERYSRAAFRTCKARHLAGWLGTEREVVLAGNREAKRMARLLRTRGVRIAGYVDVDPRRIGTSWQGLPVVGYEALALDPARRVCLAAVGSRGAREKIRRRLCAMGYRESADFVCVA